MTPGKENRDLVHQNTRVTMSNNTEDNLMEFQVKVDFKTKAFKLMKQLAEAQSREKKSNMALKDLESLFQKV